MKKVALSNKQFLEKLQKAFSSHLQDPSRIERGFCFLKKFRGEELSFYEALFLAKSWLLTAQNSLELSDLSKCFFYFSRARNLGIFPEEFELNLGEAFLLKFDLSLEGDSLNQAITCFKTALAQNGSYVLAWRHLIKAKCLQIEAEESDPHEIDPLFFEAISSCPTVSDFWLHWAKFYIEQGWLRKEIALVEQGVVALSHAAVSDPNLLAMGLLMLGLFSDDLKLLRLAENKIQKMSLGGKFASGFAQLVLGIYFSDATYVKKAITNLKKIEEKIFGLHVLFEAYLSYAVFGKKKRYFSKALDLINEISRLRPKVSMFLYETGLCAVQAQEKNVAILLKAKEKMEKALQLQGKNDPKYLFHYATLLEQLGVVTGDNEYFEMGVEILSPLLSELPENSAQTLNIFTRLTFLVFRLSLSKRDADLLFKAHQLFEIVAKKRQEEDLLFCAWGELLLHLADLCKKSSRLSQAAEYRALSEKKLMWALELGNMRANYLLACLYSLAEQYERAVEYLERCLQIGVLPRMNTLLHEEFFEGLNKTSLFQNFLNEAKAHGKKRGRRKP